MEGMRNILKSSVGKALRELREEDRIAAAWAVACGRLLAERSAVVGFDRGWVRIEVTEDAWLRQFISMRSQLLEELSRIAEVKVDGIHFELKRLDLVEKGNSGNE